MSIAELAAVMNQSLAPQIAAVAILHNVTAGTYHPIIFRDAPMPGGDGPRRVKSIGHHTTGFPTHAAATESVRADERMRGAVIDTDRLVPWDGDGVPALVGMISGDSLVFLGG